MENVINFYLEANKLKDVIRTGWKEVGIPADKIESVADHIYGTMTLVIGIISELKGYSDIDFAKIYKMLFVKELVKAKTSERSVLSKEEKKEADRENIISMLEPLQIRDELLSLYDEAVAEETKDAKFVLYVSKLESDIQAKKYEMDGYFTLENALKDIEYYPEDIKKSIKPQVENASDGWILFDRRYYEGNDDFVNLSNKVQGLK